MNDHKGLPPGAHASRTPGQPSKRSDVLSPPSRSIHERAWSQVATGLTQTRRVMAWQRAWPRHPVRRASAQVARGAPESGPAQDPVLLFSGEQPDPSLQAGLSLRARVTSPAAKALLGPRTLTQP